MELHSLSKNFPSAYYGLDAGDTEKQDRQNLCLHGDSVLMGEKRQSANKSI